MSDAAKSAAVEVVRTLRDHGHQAYLVGGCVRDLILGREPADYDVATDARPDTVMRIFPETYAVGAQFGVVLVPISDHQISGSPDHQTQEPTPDERDLARLSGAHAHHGVIEVATFRSDGLYTDGRHPDEVRFSQTAAEDVQRRDFTINGLLLDETGLLHEVLPEIERMKGIEQPPEFHPEGDVFVHTLLLLERLPQPCSPTLAWGALLHDVGKPPTFRIAPDRIRFDNHVEVGVKIAEEICRRLRFSNEDTKQILALVDNHMRFGDVQRMRESTFKRFVRLPHFDEHLELHRLDCLASHGDLSLYEFARQKRARMPQSVVCPAPLLSGDDLISAGYKPGPLFKQILTAVEDAQLEGRLQTKSEAIDRVLREFPLSESTETAR